MPPSRTASASARRARDQRIIDTALANRHATGREIANEQGVSPSTVSRVLRRRLGLMIGDPPRRARRPDNGEGPVHLDLWPHALDATGRERMTTALTRTETLAGLIGRTIGRRINGPVTGICATRNGVIIAPAMWAETVLQPGDIITLRVRPESGDDSDPVRIALMLVVVTAALTIPGAQWGLALAKGTLAFNAATAGILIGGQLIVDAIAPARLPEPPDQTAGRKADQTHTLSGGGNRPRTYQPLPLVLGTHRMFADLGALDYNTWGARRRQDYNAIYNFGLRLSPAPGGVLDVRDLQIGGTRMSDYGDVEIEWDTGVTRRNQIKLVAGNVDTISGAVLDDTDWVVRRTSPNTDYFELDFSARIFVVGSKGGRHSYGVEIIYQYRLIPPEGDPPDWETQDLTIIGDPQGGDDLIIVSPRPQTLNLSGSTVEPFGRTLRRDLLTPGVYEIRLRRKQPKSTSDHITDDVTWSALRSYQPDTASYELQTRLALRIRASGQLSGRLDSVNALVTQRIPTLDTDSGEWVVREDGNHSNPAAIFRAYCVGNSTSRGSACGINLPPERIDDESLARWYRFCEDRKLTCNLVLTAPASHAEVLGIIGACGRASPTWASGGLGVIIEDRDTPPSALIHPGNIIAGSMTVNWSGQQDGGSGGGALHRPRQRLQLVDGMA